VWTGDEVLLWPEPDDPSGPRPGVAWNPDTDQWRRLATQPRPSDGVSAGTVVWTGREMVVVAYGAAYDPTSNSWRDLADPPFEGSVNDVVWTGEEIVASVGLGGGVEAYDPDADTWRTLAPLESTAGSVSLTSTGERIVAIDNDMAAWTLEDGHWQTVEQLPLRSSECGIDTVMTTTGVLAVHCAGYGLLDSDGRWSIGPPPTHPVMSLVATGDEVLAWWSTDEDFNFGPLARTWFQAYRPPERLGDDRALERTIPVGAVLLDLPADARLVRARGSLRYEVDLELGGVECRVTSTYLGDYPVAAGIRRTARDLDGAVLRHIRLPEVDVGRDRALVALVPQDQLDDRAHAYVEATTSDTVEITCPYLGRVERLLAGIHR
jgi:hypothetical protein